MAKTALFYDKATGEIISIVTVSRKSDMKLNIKEGCERLDVAPAHDAIKEPEKYLVKSGKAAKKPQQQIDAEKLVETKNEELKKIPEFLKSDDDIKAIILLDKINELRKKAGFNKAITDDEIKAEIETRRAKYKNPERTKLL